VQVGRKRAELRELFVATAETASARDEEGLEQETELKLGAMRLFEDLGPRREVLAKSRGGDEVVQDDTVTSIASKQCMNKLSGSPIGF
jgi:hypothetical protein